MLSVTTVTHSSLTISWVLDEGYVSTSSYTILYSNDNTDCFNDSMTLTTGDTMYRLIGLEEGTEYSITVIAILNRGVGIVEETITATTMPAGESSLSLLSFLSLSHTHSSICPSLLCEILSGTFHSRLCPLGTSGTLC